MNRSIAIATVGVAACALTLGISAPSFAATTPPIDGHSTLAQIQAAGAAQTAKRITSLNAGVSKVNGNKTLTDGDRSTVLGRLNTDLTAMSTVEAKIAADTTVKSALSDYRSIFTDYRVYAVVLPQSYEAAAGDGLTDTAIPKLQSAHDKLAANLAANPSKWTDAMKAQLTDMQAKLSDAGTRANGLAARALAVTPAAYNADKTLIANIRTDLKAALADTKAASADAHSLVAALK